MITLAGWALQGWAALAFGTSVLSMAIALALNAIAPGWTALAAFGAGLLGSALLAVVLGALLVCRWIAERPTEA